MYEEDIMKLNGWFDDAVNYSFYTSRNSDDEYTVEKSDVEKFCDFLRENVSDLVGFTCMIGEDGIWFTRDSLDKAEFY